MVSRYGERAEDFYEPDFIECADCEHESVVLTRFLPASRYPAHGGNPEPEERDYRCCCIDGFRERDHERPCVECIDLHLNNWAMFNWPEDEQCTCRCHCNCDSET